MQKLIHFTHTLKPNTEGYNTNGGVDGHIIQELQINTKTHTYEILNMSQSVFTKSGGGTAVVTTLLIETKSKF